MIEPRLKKLDAIAGTPKKSFAFSIPMTSAASETSRMNGNMMRVSRMVRSAFSGSNPGARIPMSCGANSTPSTVTALMKTTVSVATLFAKAHADFSPCVVICFENVVTNAVDNAPSANRSRNMFGARNAVRNASRLRVAPKSEAMTISRTSPRMRLHKIAIPTTPVARALTRLLGVPAIGTETRARVAPLKSEIVRRAAANSLQKKRHAAQVDDGAALVKQFAA